jgi:hypothetical protein
VQEETGLFCTDVVRFGAHGLLSVISYQWLIQSQFIIQSFQPPSMVVRYDGLLAWTHIPHPTGLGNGCRGNSGITPTITFFWMLLNFLLTKATWHDIVFTMGNPCAYRPSFHEFLRSNLLDLLQKS